MKKILILLFLLSCGNSFGQSELLKLKSEILFKGDSITAYRAPAVLYYNKIFYLLLALNEVEADGKVFTYVAATTSGDLINWSTLRKITPRDQNLDEATARLFIMRSKDLVTWSQPELLKVKGPDVPVEKMGRMIDPYIIEDKDEKGKYWCFYKQNGVSMSYSYDLINWTFFGNNESGENVYVLTENNEYILFHSPSNGIEIKKSADLKKWTSWGELITLGQSQWDWAKGRIGGAAVINLLNVKGFENYLMFFYGLGPLPESQGNFDKNVSVGIAWSKDLINWKWPEK